MNHSAPIGPDLQVITKGVVVLGVKPMSKGVATGQFLQTMLATMQPVPEAKAVSKSLSDTEARLATADSTVQMPVALYVAPMTDGKTPPTAVVSIHPEVGSPDLIVHIPIVMPAKTVLSAKVSGTPSVLPSTVPATTKKSVQREGGDATPELVQVSESAAPMLAILPRELPRKPASDAEGQTEEAISESCVTVAVGVNKAAKNLGSIAVGNVKTSKGEVRKEVAIVPATAHPLQGGPMTSSIPTAPLVVSHDPAHSFRDVSALGSGVAAVGNVVSPASHSGSVAKTVGIVAPQVDATSQATDLKTLVATPNVLEVGVASGAHGWLKVRAEFAQTGEVAASVVAGSASAAQSLHKELPGISAYLAGERVGVSSLVVNSAERGAGAQSSTLGSGMGGASTTDDGRSHGSKDLPGAAAKGSSRDADVDVDTPSLLGMSLPLVLHANGSGSWLSVRV